MLNGFELSEGLADRLFNDLVVVDEGIGRLQDLGGASDVGVRIGDSNL